MSKYKTEADKAAAAPQKRAAPTKKAPTKAPAKTKVAPAKGATKKPSPKKMSPEQAALLEAEKFATEAAAKATKLKKEAAAVEAKEKKAADRAKAEETAARKLIPMAKEINVRFDKAAKLIDQADDHRLSASLKIAEAEKYCKANKIAWKPWAEKNIEQSYESVRKLLPIGVAETKKEGEGAKLLEATRTKNKVANKKLRDKNKEEPKKIEDKSSGKVDGDGVPTGENNQREGDDMTDREAAEAAFNLLGRKAKVSFAMWAADQVGAEFTLTEG